MERPFRAVATVASPSDTEPIDNCKYEHPGARSNAVPTQNRFGVLHSSAAGGGSNNGEGNFASVLPLSNFITPPFALFQPCISSYPPFHQALS